MKQCPICGHRTEEDACPVCGSATVTLKNDPQEKAQRTIQYQRFDPSKTPGTAAGNHAAPSGVRNTQQDPGAARQPAAQTSGQPQKPARPQQPVQTPAPQRPVQQQVPAQQVPQERPAAPAGMAAQNERPAAPTTPKAPEAPATESRPAAPKPPTASTSGSGEYRPSTIPRRSAKYRKKYAAYGAAEQAPQQTPQEQAPVQAQATQTPVSVPETSAPAQIQQPEVTQTPPAVTQAPASQIPEEPDDLPAEFDELLIPETDSEIIPEESPEEPESDAAPAADPTEQEAAADPAEQDAAENSADLIATQDDLDSAKQEPPADPEEPEPEKTPETSEANGTPETSEADETPEMTGGDEASATDEPSESDESSEADETLEADETPEPQNADADFPEDMKTEEPRDTSRDTLRQDRLELHNQRNRDYAQMHAKRAARRWEEEARTEPFAIVKDTCYFSALEGDDTVRGNFSKKRYKNDTKPQPEPVSYEESEWYQGFETAEDPWGDYVEPGEKKQGVSHKTWFVILWLIIFWPVGLILMWARKKFPLAVRIIITLIIAGGLAAEGFFLYQYGAEMYSDLMNSSTTSETTQIDSDTQTSSGDTSEQQKALDRAKEYLNNLPLSHDGLITQLEYDGYSNADATYAADNCGADWNQQAAKMAEQTLTTGSYTRDSMIQKLQSDGFTKDQAAYGADSVDLK